MPKQIPKATSETCTRIKAMGYATGNQIHIYGEKFEVLSDPFPFFKLASEFVE